MDFRYAISAVPFACLALGLAFIRSPAPGLTPAAPAARDGLAAPTSAATPVAEAD